MIRPIQTPSVSHCAWILGGVHGKEPAGTVAICEYGAFPDYCLVIPCANPLAFLKGEHHGDRQDYGQVFRDLADLADAFPPRLILNCHEDDEAFQYAGFYLYHYGEDKRLPRIVLDAVRAAKLPIAPSEDDTWENERIQDGIIVSPQEDLDDPNIDEYAWGVFGAEVIVAETPSTVWPVKARLRAHRAVLSTLPKLWELLTG